MTEKQEEPLQPIMVKTANRFRRYQYFQIFLYILASVLSSIFTENQGSYFWAFGMFIFLALFGIVSLSRSSHSGLLLFFCLTTVSNLASTAGLLLSYNRFYTEDCDDTDEEIERNDAFCDGDPYWNNVVLSSLYALFSLSQVVSTRLVMNCISDQKRPVAGTDAVQAVQQEELVPLSRE